MTPTPKPIRNRFRRIARRHWRRALRMRGRLRVSEEAINFVLAGFVGLIGGLVNLSFFRGAEWLMRISLRHEGDPVEVAELLPEWQRALATMLGGLIAGLILEFGLKLLGKQSASNLLEAVAIGNGKLRFRAGMIKSVSSLCTIASGGSIGREGAITQLTAMFASKLGQFAMSPPYRLRLLVACGAAAGIAAPYNAPIGGAVFAALIVLGNFSMTTFAPLVCSSAVACVVSRGFFGVGPLYEVPSFEGIAVLELPLFLLLGLLAGLLGVVFMKSLRGTEALFRKIRAPLFVRMMLGGLLVGLIATRFPEVWGNGFLVTNRILQENYILPVLAGVFAAKLVATLLTVGSGAVGGVFTPTLFLGAALGSLCGALLHAAHLAEALPTGAFALAGMGSMLAATTQSPLLAVILIFEISLDYSAMPAVMLGCGVAAVVARGLHADSVYAENKRLREVAEAREAAAAGTATEQTVGDWLRAPVPPLRENEPLKQIAKRFLSSSNNFLPVVNEEMRLVGVVALQDLKEFLNTGEETSAVIAYDVMRPPPRCLTPSQPLADALTTVLASELRNIPVVNSLNEMRLVGSVQRAELLAMYADAVARAARRKG